MSAVQSKPEWSFQANLHRFLERVVLPPFEVRGYDKANKAMASMKTRMMAIGRGIKDGTPDHEAVQGAPLVVVKFECKAGTGKPTVAQIGTADSYERCGITVARDCRTIAQALIALRRSGMRLHANADNLAVEYQARVEAGLRELQERKKRRRPPTSPHSAKPSTRTIARFERARKQTR